MVYKCPHCSTRLNLVTVSDIEYCVCPKCKMQKDSRSFRSSYNSYVYSNEDSFNASFLAGMITGDPMMGYAAGGSMSGAMLGSSFNINDSSYSSSSYSSDSSSSCSNSYDSSSSYSSDSSSSYSSDSSSSCSCD